MALRFRVATQGDLRKALEMIRDFYLINGYPFDREKVMAVYQKFISDESLGRFWLLEENDKIIGYLALTYGYSFEYGGRDAFIDEFYIKADFRGKGIGTLAMKMLVDKAESLGVHAIHLEVERTNEKGVELYRKSGFKGNDRALLTKTIIN